MGACSQGSGRRRRRVNCAERYEERRHGSKKAAGPDLGRLAPRLAATSRHEPLDDETVKQVIAEAEAELQGKGRLVIRPSGTEPVIRVMAEGDDAAQVEACVDRICDAVKAAA